MKNEIDIDYKDGSIAIQYNETYYCIAISEDFVFYDSLINQPHFAFIINNSTSEIQILKNVGDTSIKFISLVDNNSTIWTNITDEDACIIYDYMKNMIEHTFEIKNEIKTVYRPCMKAISYDCKKTYFKNTNEYL